MKSTTTFLRFDRRYSFLRPFLLVLIILISLVSPASRTDRLSAPAHTLLAHGRVAECPLPMWFEANLGQAGNEVKYFARGRGYTLFFTPNEAMISLVARRGEAGELYRDRLAIASGSTPQRSDTSTQALLKMRLVGANAKPSITAEGRLPGQSSYFIGNDSATWRAGTPHYERIRYEQVYPGIDLVYYGRNQELEFDFVVAPGSDPRAIEMDFTGVERIEITNEGDVRLLTGDSEIRQRLPVIYQEIGGQRREIGGRYVKRGGRIGFEIDNYDPGQKLVIDPVLNYASYFGGSGEDVGNAIAVDNSGNIYVTGNTASLDLPTRSPIQTSNNGGAFDAFVLKLNPSATGAAALVYATYLGGSDREESRGIATDSAGQVYIAGFTTSTNFPTRNAFRNTNSGGADAFVTKLNPSATGAAQLVYSTYFGASGTDEANDVAVDGSGNINFTGRTLSSDLPTTPGAFQTSFAGVVDTFVTRLNPSASGSAQLLYSTYLGGSQGEVPKGIAVDSTGRISIAGDVVSTNYPVTPTAYQSGHHGGTFDSFVTKLNPSTTGAAQMLYSTYLGGSSVEFTDDVATDSGGNIYVTGQGFSDNFPFRSAFQNMRIGGSDAFLARFNPEASGAASLVYSTYLGGNAGEFLVHMAVSGTGDVYLIGTTSSSDFPRRDEFQSMFGGEDDAFIAKVNTSLTGSDSLIYSSYLGGSASDAGRGIAIDATGNAYVTGSTRSSNFPVTVGAFQTTFGGGAVNDAFIAKIGGPGINTAASVSAASYKGPELAPDSIAAAFGQNLATSTQSVSTIPLPTSLAGTTVEVTDNTGMKRLAPLFFVSSGQVNYLIPSGVAAGATNVTIRSSAGAVSSGMIQVVTVMPGLFSANSDGQGVPAAQAFRIRISGAESYEPVAEYNAAQQRFIPLPINLGPETDQVFLVLYGTGIRFRSSLSAVTVNIGGVNSEVLFAGASPEFIGVDQVNSRLPRSLIGRGEVNVILTVDGRMANAVKVAIN